MVRFETFSVALTHATFESTLQLVCVLDGSACDRTGADHVRVMQKQRSHDNSDYSLHCSAFAAALRQ